MEFRIQNGREPNQDEVDRFRLINGIHEPVCQDESSDDE
jgi:hypothetical protein